MALPRESAMSLQRLPFFHNLQITQSNLRPVQQTEETKQKTSVSLTIVGGEAWCISPGRPDRNGGESGSDSGDPDEGGECGSRDGGK